MGLMSDNFRLVVEVQNARHRCLDDWSHLTTDDWTHDVTDTYAAGDCIRIRRINDLSRISIELPLEEHAPGIDRALRIDFVPTRDLASYPLELLRKSIESAPGTYYFRKKGALSDRLFRNLQFEAGGALQEGTASCNSYRRLGIRPHAIKAWEKEILDPDHKLSVSPAELYIDRRERAYYSVAPKKLPTLPWSTVGEIADPSRTCMIRTSDDTIWLELEIPISTRKTADSPVCSQVDIRACYRPAVGSAGDQALRLAATHMKEGPHRLREFRTARLPGHEDWAVVARSGACELSHDLEDGKIPACPFEALES